MPDLDINLNIFVMGLLLVAAVLIGFLPRSRQLARKSRQITRLEQEMVQAHAELLEAQRECLVIEAKLKDITNPVIALNSKSSDDPPQTPLPERDALSERRSARRI